MKKFVQENYGFSHFAYEFFLAYIQILLIRTLNFKEILLVI